MFSFCRPPAGSLTEKRGLAAERHIQTEIIFLCETIYQYGEKYEDGTAAIPFGELFSVRNSALTIIQIGEDIWKSEKS